MKYQINFRCHKITLIHPETKIKFDISSNNGEKSNVKLVVYDIVGKEVATLLNERLEPGRYEVSFNGNNFASGIYFYNIQTNNFSEIKRMVLIK